MTNLATKKKSTKTLACRGTKMENNNYSTWSYIVDIMKFFDCVY